MDTRAKLLDKIESTKAILAKYERQLARFGITDDTKPGDTVRYEFGRGDSKRVLTGKVQAIGDVGGPMGTIAVIQHGEGLDIQIHKVRIHDVLENLSQAIRGPKAVQQDIDPLTAD